MPKAIDMHVHLPTSSWLDVAIQPYRVPAEKFFRATVPTREMEEVARLYESLDILGVLLAWDAETATGLAPLTTDEVASIVRRYPKQFIGFASVDPCQGKKAIAEMERAVGDLGMRESSSTRGSKLFIRMTCVSILCMRKSPTWGSRHCFTPGRMA